MKQAISFTTPVEKLKLMRIPFVWATVNTSFLEHAFHLIKAPDGTVLAISECEMKAAFPERLEFNDYKKRCNKCKELCNGKTTL
jgi:hypothetical protein